LRLHVSLGISSHHRRTTIASLSWPLLLIHAWQSCIPCRVSFYFSGFLWRKGNYRDSFGRHSSLPFIIILFSERTHCLRFFISFLFHGWRNCLRAWWPWKNVDVHGFLKTVGRLALYSVQTISVTIHSMFDYLWLFGFPMRR